MITATNRAITALYFSLTSYTPYHLWNKNRGFHIIYGVMAKAVPYNNLLIYKSMEEDEQLQTGSHMAQMGYV
jgi:hypothetical protein